MKRLLLPLLAALALPVAVNAEETCVFVSQYQPELTIEIGTKNLTFARGLMKYRDTPLFNFETSLSTGYGGQYFSIGTIPNSSIDKEETIVSGHVVTIIGDQAGTKGTPKNKRKRGQEKLFLPSFAQNYYSSLTTDGTKEDRRFEGRTEKITTILRAAEGFWIPSEICKKFVYYSWM